MTGDINKWLKKRDHEEYCVITFDVDNKKARLSMRLTVFGRPQGEVIGEYWYEDGELKVEYYKTWKGLGIKKREKKQ